MFYVLKAEGDGSAKNVFLVALCRTYRNPSVTHWANDGERKSAHVKYHD